MEIHQNPLVFPVHVIAKMINSPKFYFCVSYNSLPITTSSTDKQIGFTNSILYIHFNRLKLTGDITVAFLFTSDCQTQAKLLRGKKEF